MNRASELEIDKMKNKLAIDHKEIKKELNIMIYLTIAFATGVTTLINWKMISPDPIVELLNNGMLPALAFYTAFDSIGDKRRERMEVQ